MTDFNIASYVARSTRASGVTKRLSGRQALSRLASLLLMR